MKFVTPVAVVARTCWWPSSKKVLRECVVKFLRAPLVDVLAIAFLFIFYAVSSAAPNEVWGTLWGNNFFIITYELEKKKPLSGSEGWNQGIVLRPRL